MKDIVREEQNLADVTHKKHFGNNQILICDILKNRFSYSHKPKFSNTMTIKAIQDKLYQYGYNWQYTWTGEIYVSKVNTCYHVFRSWNKVKETIFWWLK